MTSRPPLPAFEETTVIVLRKWAWAVRSRRWGFVSDTLYHGSEHDEAVIAAEAWAKKSTSTVPTRSQIVALVGTPIDARKTREGRRTAFKFLPRHVAVGKPAARKGVVPA